METNDNVEIRLIDVIGVIRRRKALIIALTIIGLVTTGALAFMLPKVYRVESTLIAVMGQQSSIPDSLLGQLGGFGGLAGALITGGGGAEEEAIAFLQSRSLIRDFIDQRDLLPILFPSRDEGNDTPTVWDGVQKFENEIRNVERDRISGLIRFAIEWTDSVTALEWNKALVTQANSRLRERAIREAQRNIKFLQSELDKTSVVELRQSIYQLMETQIRSVMLAEARPEYAFRVVDAPMMPDSDEFVRPRRALLAIIGSMLGFLAALMIALYLDRDLLLTRQRS